ncbi:MAG: alpha/beta hydrolase [Halobacteriovoraceae bacterium]|nr:alpha/beta hydrolase [Halobacteriovoraceae bacterium]MCB9095836.1 alpha/beta hydrolase [Halobacteriovoraceae bacterium]
MKYLYFHGGPGFNANPERNILTPIFEKNGLEIAFWEEPSVLRPDGPAFVAGENCFQNYINELEKFFKKEIEGQNKVALIGHSFGCHSVSHLALNFQESISKVYLIAPDLDLPAADINMLTIGRDDYFNNQEIKAATRLTEILENFDGKMTEELEEGFQLLLSNPRFLGYYWKNLEVMPNYFSHYADPEYGFDYNSFVTMRRVQAFQYPNNSSIEAHLILGSHDNIISKKNERKLVNQYFPQVIEHIFEDSAHYPHIEEKEKFINTILGLAQSADKSAFQRV